MAHHEPTEMEKYASEGFGFCPPDILDNFRTEAIIRTALAQERIADAQERIAVAMERSQHV